MRFVLGIVLCMLAGSAAAQSPPARPTLGIGVGDLPANGRIHGAWVGQVAPNSAASTAGLRLNDVIIGVDGVAVPRAAALTAYIRSRGVGDTVTLEILRSNGNDVSKLTLTATLGSAAASAPQAQAPAAAKNQGPPAAPSVPADSAPPASAAATAAGHLQWIGFTEPNEQAFSTEVPRGWHVAGSIARRAALGPSPYLRVLSEDRQVYIVLGDPSITLFTTPLRSTSTRPAWQGQVIRAYASSIPFARDYVTQILPTVCGGVSVTGQKDRPDLTQGSWASANPNAQHSGGEVTFSCRRNGAEMRGKVEVETYIYPAPANIGGAIWTVDLLAGYLAPPDRYADAGILMKRIVEAMRYSPEWIRNEQAKNQAALHGINAATEANSRIAQEALASAQRKMHATARQFEAFDRVINGSSPYVDSAGNHYQLDNTKTQWIGPGGRILGTDGASPGPGWQQLKEVPPE